MEPNEGPLYIKPRKLSIAFLLNDVSIEPRARCDNSPKPIRSEGDMACPSAINVPSDSLSTSVELNDDSSLSSSRDTTQSLNKTFVQPLSSLSQDSSFTAESSNSGDKRTQTTFSWTPEHLKKLIKVLEKGRYLGSTTLRNLSIQSNVDVSQISNCFNEQIYDHSTLVYHKSSSLTDTQLKKMRKVLVQDYYPGTDVRERLARELFLDEKRIRRWFSKKKRLFSFQWTTWNLNRLYSEFARNSNLCFRKRESLAAQLNIPQEIVADWFEEQREQLRTGISYYGPLPYIHAMKPVLPFMTSALPGRLLLLPPLQNPSKWTPSGFADHASSSKSIQDSTADQNSKE